MTAANATEEIRIPGARASRNRQSTLAEAPPGIRPAAPQQGSESS